MTDGVRTHENQIHNLVPNTFRLLPQRGGQESNLPRGDQPIRLSPDASPKDGIEPSYAQYSPKNLFIPRQELHGYQSGLPFPNSAAVMPHRIMP